MAMAESKDATGHNDQQRSQPFTSREERYRYKMETWRLWCLHRVLQARLEARGYPDGDGTSTTPRIVDVRSITVAEFDRMGQKGSKRPERSRKPTTSRSRAAKPSKKWAELIEKATSQPDGAEQPKKCTPNAKSPLDGAEQPEKCTPNTTLQPPNGAEQSKKCTKSATSPPKDAEQSKKCTKNATSPTRGAEQPKKYIKNATPPPKGADQPNKCTKNATSPPKCAEQPKKSTKNAKSPPNGEEQPKKCIKNAASPPNLKGEEQHKKCTKDVTSSPRYAEPTNKLIEYATLPSHGFRPWIWAENADVGSTRPSTSNASCVQNTDEKLRKRTHGSTTPVEAGLPKQPKYHPGRKVVGKTSESKTVLASVPTSASISSPTVVTHAARQKPISPQQPMPGVPTSYQRFWQPWQDHTYFDANRK
ncbi:Hypp7412 [Branchiostoma lanceolatum]|uniref:Hypp7412 protein n=1 Tax=Branchiostoma lanceolatum TaxID=7740 RepID=A0A8K0EA21_BRALA|nr:Hypp7412 [Branchiostoma lanceolatum]